MTDRELLEAAARADLVLVHLRDGTYARKPFHDLRDDDMVVFDGPGEFAHLEWEPEWVEFNGGRCPVDAGCVCDTKHRDGSVTTERLVHEAETWSHLGTPCDIVAYRNVRAAAAMAERGE